MHVSLWVDFPLSFLLLGLVYFFLPFFNLEGVWGGGGGDRKLPRSLVFNGTSHRIDGEKREKERNK